MRISNPIRFTRLAAALACAVCISACAGFGMGEPLSATLSYFAPVEVGVFEQRYDMRIRLQNSTDTDLAFDGVTFDLAINDKAFAKGVSAEKGVVPRFGEAVVSVSAVSGLSGVLRQISEYQDGKRQGFSYRISGRLHGYGLGGIPFESSGEFKMPAEKS